jgi:hypothetical protein
MAKLLSKLKGFFDGKRRVCRLDDYRLLKTKGDERRVKLMVSMPLSHQPADGMPDDFLEPFLLMEKEKSKTNFSKIGVILEGALFTIYSTDVSPTPDVKGTSATLQDFKLIASGVDEKRTVALEFVAYMPWSVSLRNWKDENCHSDFFVEVIPQQMELPVEEKAEKPVKAKKSKQTEFDPEAIQKAAKRGTLVQ